MNQGRRVGGQLYYGDVDILKWVDKVGLIKTVIFDQRPEGDEAMSHVSL